MRLHRLDLVRYGCFTDFVIDFGAHDPAKPDLHVIYGPNESGKSTLLSAYLDLIFGIEKRSPYNFLHDYRSMRIGASLDIGGRTRNLARIKRDNESLLGPADQPLPESVLAGVLGSIDRASYTTMFSLDDDTLQSGGESILESKGDLGRLLFSATSGLSELSRQLDEIKSEAEAFHRPGGRATGLKELKDRLVELKRRQGEGDINARRYGELLQSAAAAQNAYETAKSERDRARLRHDLVGRLLDSLPLWSDLKELRTRLAPLAGLPDPPPGWAEEAQQLAQDAAAKNADIDGAAAERSRLAGELDGMVVDQGILALAERIDRLNDEGARYRSAVDFPARESEREAVNAQITGIVVKVLGRPAADDPGALLLPAATVGALTELIETRSGLVAAHDAAQREHDATRDRVDLARTSVETLGAPLDVSALEAVLKRLRGEELGARIRQSQRRLEEIAAEIEVGLDGLRPWQGDLEALAELAPPMPERVERWKHRLATAREAQATLTQKQGELVEARDGLQVTIAAVTASSGEIDDQRAADLRTARDAAWQAHRRLLVAAAADPAAINPKALLATGKSFEAALAEDDRLADLRARESTALARLRHAGEQLAQTEAALSHVTARLDDLATEQTALAHEIGTALRPLGPCSELELTDLQRWLERRDGLLEKRAGLKKAEREQRAAADACAAARDELSKAIAAAGGLPEGELQLPWLLELAQDLVEQAKARATAITAVRAALREAELALQERARDAAHRERALRQWREGWSRLLNGCWLGQAGSEPSPAEVRQILQALSGLPALIEKRDDFGRRIQAMGEDRDRFVVSVRALAAEAGLAFEAEKVLEVADDLRRRLTEARQQVKLQGSKQADLERAETRGRQAKQAMAEIDARRKEMGAFFSVENLTELPSKLAQAKEKATLREQIESRERALVDALRQPSLNAAEAALTEMAGTPAAIEALREESVALTSRLEDEDKRVAHLYHEAMTARDAIAAVGGDGEVARLEEERLTLLLEIQDEAERYLRLKAGVAAAERALQIYRDRHRSSMMARAGEAFRRITRQRFTRLATTPGKDGEVLVGIRSSGGSLIASEMSKGTRFQLYLALRLAGYHDFAEHRESLPFIADDIMETFDDERSTEAFRLLASIAEKGQVIYLTHHPHMRDMARRVLGNAVRIHDLPAQMLGPPVELAAASATASGDRLARPQRQSS